MEETNATPAEGKPAEESFAEARKRAGRVPVPDATHNIPSWATVPGDLKLPAGRQVFFIRLRASWTDVPSKGERQAILWSLNDADEKLGLDRSRTDPNRVINELSKQMIRAVDGHVADWSGEPTPGNVEQWWNEVGARCRTQITRLYTQLHVLGEDEQRDFFENCIAVRAAVG